MEIMLQNWPAVVTVVVGILTLLFLLSLSRGESLPLRVA